MLRESVTMKYVAKQLNVSPTTISRIFNYVNYSSNIKPPHVLSIDEFRENAERKFQCILTDPTNHKVIDILKGRELHILSYYFNKIKTEIKLSFLLWICGGPLRK